MEKKLRVRPRGVVFLGLAVGLCLAPVEELAPAFVAVEVGGDAWGCGGYKDIPDPRCLDPDTDGDGIPDSRDPCPDNPNTQCEELVVRGNPNDSGFPVTCMDGTRVTSVRECSEYEAVFGYNPTGGNGAGSGSGRGGVGQNGGSRSSPRPSVAAAKRKVEGCIAGKSGRKVIDDVKEQAGRLDVPITVSSGGVSGGLGLTRCIGLVGLRGNVVPNKISITMDEQSISKVVNERHGTRQQTEYTHLFATVLLHEYYHAKDCIEGERPIKPTKYQHEMAEGRAENSSNVDYQTFFGVRSPLDAAYDHGTDGDPECI